MGSRALECRDDLNGDGNTQDLVLHVRTLRTAG